VRNIFWLRAAEWHGIVVASRRWRRQCASLRVSRISRNINILRRLRSPLCLFLSLSLSLSLCLSASSAVIGISRAGCDHLRKDFGGLVFRLRKPELCLAELLSISALHDCVWIADKSSSWRVYLDDNVVLARGSPLFIRLRLESLFGRGSGAEVGADARLGRGCCNEEAKFASPRRILQFAAPSPGSELWLHVRVRKRERVRGPRAALSSFFQEREDSRLHPSARFYAPTSTVQYREGKAEVPFVKLKSLISGKQRHWCYVNRCRWIVNAPARSLANTELRFDKNFNDYRPQSVALTI